MRTDGRGGALLRVLLLNKLQELLGEFCYPSRRLLSQAPQDEELFFINKYKAHGEGFLALLKIVSNRAPSIRKTRPGFLQSGFKFSKV